MIDCVSVSFRLSRVRFVRSSGGRLECPHGRYKTRVPAKGQQALKEPRKSFFGAGDQVARGAEGTVCSESSKTMSNARIAIVMLREQME